MLASITNDVLCERQSQQHSQIMDVLVRIDGKLEALNGSVHDGQVINAQQELRIGIAEGHLSQVDIALMAMQRRLWKVVIAAALLAGAGAAGVSEILKLLL